MTVAELRRAEDAAEAAADELDRCVQRGDGSWRMWLAKVRGVAALTELRETVERMRREETST